MSMTAMAICLALTAIAVAGIGALSYRALQDPSLVNVLMVVVVTALIVVAAAAIRTALLVRRLAPLVKSHRTRAEFG